MPNKFHHVRSAVLDPRAAHSCHWPDCKMQVPRAHWGCREHWMMLPKPLRDRIWAEYTMGQEEDHRLVTGGYLDAASAAQSWIRSYLAAANARVPRA